MENHFVGFYQERMGKLMGIIPKDFNVGKINDNDILTVCNQIKQAKRLADMKRELSEQMDVINNG